MQEAYSVESLMELLESPDATLIGMAEAIRRYPGLAEDLVARANAPEFGMRKRVARIEEALPLLGLSRIEGTIRLWHQRHQSAGVAGPHFLTGKRPEQPARPSPP